MCKEAVTAVWRTSRRYPGADTKCPEVVMNGRATTPATSTCTRRDHAGHDLEVHGHLPSHADYHVVCIRVGGNDYVLCMLHVLQGEAEREVVRVPVECCLQEAGWNPYYALLLGRLAAAATSHAVTLQYCLWDHFRVGAMLPLPWQPGKPGRALLGVPSRWLPCCLSSCTRVQHAIPHVSSAARCMKGLAAARAAGCLQRGAAAGGPPGAAHGDARWRRRPAAFPVEGRDTLRLWYLPSLVVVERPGPEHPAPSALMAFGGQQWMPASLGRCWWCSLVLPTTKGFHRQPRGVQTLPK